MPLSSPPCRSPRPSRRTRRPTPARRRSRPHPRRAPDSRTHGFRPAIPIKSAGRRTPRCISSCGSPDSLGAGKADKTPPICSNGPDGPTATPGPPGGGCKNSSDRLHASQDTSSRAPPDFGASRVPVGAFENQCGATPTRLSKVRGRRSRASGRKRSNRTSAGRKNADPGQAGVRIEGASCRLGKHADLIPEHVRANAPTTPPPKKRRRPKKETRTDDRAGSPRRSRPTKENGPHPTRSARLRAVLT